MGAAAGAIAAPIVGGIIGNVAAGGAREDANNAYNDALAQWTNMQAPDVEKMRLALEEYQSTGVMTPEMQQAINLGQTEMQNVSTDPRLKNSQMAALEQISGMASGQPSAADMAGFELSRQNAAGEMQAKNNQVLQEMQQRGQAGSGAELLAKLKNNQSGADMLQKAQLEQAQAMQNARIQALAQQANMSNSIRGQDYDEQSNLAQAKDAIAKFNAANQQNVSNSNVAIKNQAQLGNLDKSQSLANSNVDLRNKEQITNKNLQQLDYENKLQIAQGRSGAYTAKGNQSNQRAAETAGMWSGIGQGAGGMIGAMGGGAAGAAPSAGSGAKSGMKMTPG
jgi:hypothetical protein